MLFDQFLFDVGASPYTVEFRIRYGNGFNAPMQLARQGLQNTATSKPKAKP